MKYDVISLIYHAAMAMKKRDGGTAFALLEMGNNLRLVMRGEASIEDWNKIYVGAENEPFDIEKLLPVRGRPS